nr:RNA-binding protein 10-like isoform X2 [Lytechinus pictus]
MALDKDYYLYSIRRDSLLDSEDDSALISRARDVISRASGQIPAVPGTIDQQSLLTAAGAWGVENAIYASAAAAEASMVERRDPGIYNEGDYSEDKKGRKRDRRRDRRRDRDERKPPADRPCRTILIKHLPAEVDEIYLRGILQLFGAPIQDVRLVKHKDSGASRGFAFVEFQFLPDAQRWMEENQGTLVIGSGRASLTYSKSRGDEDWFCSQCGTQNFKRRANCFKCGIEKNESERYSQISAKPTRILLLMGLDSLTTEEKIQRELHDITAIDMNVQLIRDPTTNTSRGLCYVALSAVEYSSHLLEILNNMHPPFILDGKQISVHFCKEGTDEEYSTWTEAEAGASYEQYYQQQATEAAAAAAAGVYDQSYASYAAISAAHSSKELSAADKAALAQEQVQAACKMQLEQQQITQKLLNKMRQTSTEKKPKRVKIDLPPPGTDGSTLDPSLIIHEVKPKKSKKEQQQLDTETSDQRLQHQLSSSSEGGYYPDVSQYQYDESSGFYYDPQTGLYYDPNSQYYYNAHSQQYVYWDGTQYVPAKQDQAPTAVPQVGVPGDGAKEDKGKKEKGKVAKKVASDMRRWAATMNEMKNNKAKKGGNDFKKDNSSASADAGFAVLSKKADPAETKQSVMLALKRSSTNDEQRNKAASITNILAQYGGDSDSEPEDSGPPPSKKPTPASDSQESVPTSLTDWTKLICLLCKRQFPSKEVLVKHQQFSDLHKQNLEALKKRTGLQQQQSQGKGGGSYRDRAQERRSRFTAN